MGLGRRGELEAVHHRHAKIEQNHRRPGRPKGVHGICAIFSRLDTVAVQLQHFDERRAQHFIILNDEYLPPRREGGP